MKYEKSGSRENSNEEPIGEWIHWEIMKKLEKRAVWSGKKSCLGVE